MAKFDSYVFLLIIVSGAITVLNACNSSGAEVEEQVVPLQVGEKAFSLRQHTSGEGGLQMINLHEDEQTSIEASLDYLAGRAGKLTYLHHDQQRRLEFTLDGQTYSVDPNRIFTDAGIEMTLEDGGTYSEAAHQQVRELADEILDLYNFDEQQVVIAMHNNGLNGYSIMSYTEDGNLADDAGFVHVEEDEDINDFYYLTDRRFYDYLTERGYNAMLQDEENVTNDGSLSVYSGRRGIPYINIEAGHGHLEKQIEMINAVEQMLLELDLIAFDSE